MVAPTTLAPLLRRPNVEMRINVMWNMVSMPAAVAAIKQGQLR